MAARTALIERIGRKQRLGIFFGGVLYPRRLSEDEAPDLKVAPLPLAQSDAVDRLLRCLVHFDIWVFPRDRAASRAAHIQAWLLCWARIWFERWDVDGSNKMAIDMLSQITFTEIVPTTLIERLVSQPDEWPEIVELAELDLQRDAVDRIVRHVRAAAGGQA